MHIQEAVIKVGKMQTLFSVHRLAIHYFQTNWEPSGIKFVEKMWYDKTGPKAKHMETIIFLRTRESINKSINIHIPLISIHIINIATTQRWILYVQRIIGTIQCTIIRRWYNIGKGMQ